MSELMSLPPELREKLMKAVVGESVLIAKDVIKDLYEAFERFMMFAGPVLYNAAKKAGRLMARRLREKGLVEPGNALAVLLFTMRESGYIGDARVLGEEESRGRKVIRLGVRGTLLGSKLSGRKKPVDQPIAGFIAGWLEELWGARVDVKEKACIAKGDPECVFEIIVH